MNNVFYLDDYDLISSKYNESFLNSKITLLKNGRSIDFIVNNDESTITLSFFNFYEDGDFYQVLVNEETYNVVPRFITHTGRFDLDYTPNLNTLGSFYRSESTIFRLWAPFTSEASVVVNGLARKMVYLGKGVYELNYQGDIEKAKYHYEVKRFDEVISFRDLFSYSNVKDEDESYVIDATRLSFTNIKLENCDDPILYELSVRDFSSDENVLFEHRGKFLAFTEKGLELNGKPIGIDYLKQLGITHVQLMPVLNYDNDSTFYNWGYNPLDYNSFSWNYVEGSDAYSPINEFRSMVDALHENGLRVNLDVVYNHVYKINTSIFEKILPYYFFRYKKDGTVANGTWCGSELRTESRFLNNYLSLINERLIRIYDIDGLRFDLAGIIDVNTINSLTIKAKSIKNDFMMYGEGWNMGDVLPEINRTTIANAKKTNGFAYFNGDYRNLLCGETNNLNSIGFLAGNRENEEKVKDGLRGSVGMGLNKNQTINYIECHDDYTFIDRLYANFKDSKDIKQIAKMGLATVLLSCGTPFIHSGQEFLRTKKGNRNTYNMNDDVNKLDWSLMCVNSDVVDYFKALTSFRKKHPLFKNDKTVEFNYYYDLLIYSIENIDMFINPSDYLYTCDNGNTYTNILYPDCQVLNNLNKFDVPPHSIVIGEKL